MRGKDFGLSRGLPDPELSERIERYLDGRGTSEDRRIVEEWAAADSANAEFLQRVVRAERVGGNAPELWDSDDAWTRLAARLDGRAPAEVIVLQPRRRSFAGAFRVAGALRVAAAVLALVGGALLWQYRADVFTPSAGPVREFAAESGQRVTLHLPDGSEVVLGAASRLWIPERFGREREVRLEGEAVFDIASDPEHPFLVKTDRAVTRVLGTRFGVSAFAEDGHVDVVVAEGRVGVVPVTEGPETAVGAEVPAGHAIRVGADGTLGDVRVVDADGLLAWTTGGLAFDRATLAEVARTLERRFGLRLALADSALSELRLTADFGNAGNANEIVRLIALSLGIEVRQTPNGFLLVHPVATAVPARGGERN